MLTQMKKIATLQFAQGALGLCCFHNEIRKPSRSGDQHLLCLHCINSSGMPVTTGYLPEIVLTCFYGDLSDSRSGLMVPGLGRCSHQASDFVV